MTLHFTYLDNLVYTPPASSHLMRSSRWKFKKMWVFG